MNILHICENGDVLSVIRIISKAINIIKIPVPIILFISLMFNYAQVITQNDNDALSKANKVTVKRLIAAVLVFLIPTAVSFIVRFVGSDQVNYATCLNNATPEKIAEAYENTTQKLIDNARSSLSYGDYQLAKQSLNKIKSEDKKTVFEQQLTEIKTAIENKQQQEQSDSNNSGNTSGSTPTVTPQNYGLSEEARKSLSEYIINPDDPLYSGLKHLEGVTLSDMLAANGYSVEELNQKINSAVNAIGVGKKEASVAAAMTLIETLANYGYKLQYKSNGEYNELGVNPNWGMRISGGSSTPTPGNPSSFVYFESLNCRGIVGWAMVQAYRSKTTPNGGSFTGYAGSNNYLSSDTSLSGQTTAICGVGDLIESDDHVVLVAGYDDANKRYIVVESTTWGGIILSYYKYNESGYYCRKVNF